eukprot:g10789.t1 g10789   contig4:2569802-2570509(-)
MLRQGVTKRGDSINNTSKAAPSNSHHDAVHSILQNRQYQLHHGSGSRRGRQNVSIGSGRGVRGMGMTTLRAVSPSPISAVSPVRSKSLVPIGNAGSNGSGRSKGLSSSFTGGGQSHQQQSNGFHHILGGLFHHSSAPSSLSNKKLQSKSSQGSSKSGTSNQSGNSGSTTGSEQPRRRSQSQPAPRGNSARHQPDFHHEIMNDHTALQRKESNSDPKSKNKKVRNSNNSTFSSAIV